VTSKQPSDKALREFSEAFERLKRNQPRRLLRGTPVSQNNVSREAGKDAAALRKSLYPELVRAIQDWVRAHTEPREPVSPLAQARQEIAALSARIESLQVELEATLTELARARAAIDELQRDRDVRAARGLAGLPRGDD
jgi:chromosome segregation ATPase